jgi:hypothetical protein
MFLVQADDSFASLGADGDDSSLVLYRDPSRISAQPSRGSVLSGMWSFTTSDLLYQYKHLGFDHACSCAYSRHEAGGNHQQLHCRLAALRPTVVSVSSTGSPHSTQHIIDIFTACIPATISTPHCFLQVPMSMATHSSLP